MTCKQCGKPLSKGARFCTSCGATTPTTKTDDLNAFETRPLAREDAEIKTSRHSAATEELPPDQKTSRVLSQRGPSSYETEEVPRITVVARIEDIETMAPAESAEQQVQIEPPVQIVPPAAIQPSSGRKGLALVFVLGVIVLGAGAYFFFFNSNKTPETEVGNQSPDVAKPAASTQPTVEPTPQPSVVAVAATSNQTQPDSTPAKDKSTSTRNVEADAKSSKQGAAKPTATIQPQDKNTTDGTGAALFNRNQGVALFNAGRYQDALREFEYVKKLDPGNKSVYYLIGQTYHKMGQLEKALEAYRQCTSGDYASVALNNAKALEKRLGKSN